LTNERNLNSESCKAILEVTKTIYAEENDRLKTNETKASIVLAFTGVLANIYMQYIYKRVTLEQLLTFDIIFIVLNLIGVFLTAILLLRCLTTRKFFQPDASEFVRYSEAEKEETEVLLGIASTLNNTIKQNHHILERKNEFLGDALFMLKSFLITALLHIFLREVITYYVSV
jgi:hypothetical protein